MPSTQLVPVNDLLDQLRAVRSSPEAHQCNIVTYLDRMTKAHQALTFAIAKEVELQLTYGSGIPYDMPSSNVTYTTDNLVELTSKQQVCEPVRHGFISQGQGLSPQLYSPQPSRSVFAVTSRQRRGLRGKKSKRRRVTAAAKECNVVKSSSKVTKKTVAATTLTKTSNLTQSIPAVVTATTTTSKVTQKISEPSKRVITSTSKNMRISTCISNSAQQTQVAGQSKPSIGEPSPVTTKDPSVTTKDPSVTTKDPAVSTNGQSEQNSPTVSSMLYELAMQFRPEIISLNNLLLNQLRNNSASALRKQPIVAEIKLKNGSPITSEAYQHLRSVILCSIDQMPLRNSNVPIYHSMTYNHTYINILCDDMHAYNCLEACVGEMSTVGNVQLYPLAPSACRLFCCSAIYKGVVVDAKNFLLQMYMHVRRLRTDRWIIANSKVVENETHFLFLMDELCAQLLEHKHANRLFINLNEVTFHNHGQLPNFL